MNRYTTERATAYHRWDLPIMIVSGLMTAFGIHIVVTDVNKGDPFVFIVAAAIFLGLLSAPLWVVLRRRLKQSRAKELAKVFEKSRAASLSFADIKKRTGIKNPGKVMHKLLAQGYLQNVALDDTYDIARFAGMVSDETLRDAPPADIGNELYNEKLREIRDLNDRISNRVVSRKVDRIEELTAGIFQLIVEDPDRAADARRFMSYYLPTTLKLLESYSMLEKQKYQGDNIRASKMQIESVLDTLIKGIEAQQDKLFKADVLDVESDISVLKTMMAADGLIENQNTLKMQSTH